nr:hypothetical protein Hi04_10k_c361_00010 [uncultured bacterium]
MANTVTLTFVGDAKDLERAIDRVDEKTHSLGDNLKKAGSGVATGGLMAVLGSGALAAVGPLAAATLAVGTFGLVAKSAFSAANAKMNTLKAAEQAYNKARTPAAKAAAFARVQAAQKALSGSQRTLLDQEGKLKSLWGQVVTAATPLVAQVTKLAVQVGRHLLLSWVRWLLPEGR